MAGDTPDLAEATWVAPMFRAGCIPDLVDPADSRALLLPSHVTHNEAFLVAHIRTVDSTAIRTTAILITMGTGTTFTFTESAITVMASVAGDMATRGRTVLTTILTGGGIQDPPMTRTTSGSERPRTR